MAEEYLNEADRIFLGLSDDNALKERFNRARQTRDRSNSLWEHVKDAFLEGAIHSGLGAEPVARAGLKSQGYTADQINEGEKKVIKGLEQRRAVRDLQFQDVDTLSPANIGKWAADLGGNIVGGADPTYVLGPGKNAIQRVLAQMGINTGVDALSQLQEVRRGIKEGYDPRQGALAAGGGLALQGAGEVVSRARANRAIARGSDGTSLDFAKGIGEKFGQVTSTLRPPARNKKVGGAKNSYHLSGRAIDIARGKGVSHKQIENAYRKAGYNIVESLDEGDHSHFAFNFKGGKPTGPALATKRSNTTHTDIEDMLTPAAREQIQSLIDEDPDIAKALLGAVRTSDETAREAENVVDISDRFIDPEVRELMEPVYDTPRVEDVLTPAERQEMDASAVRPEARGALSEDILNDTIGAGRVATTPVNDFMPQTTEDLRLQRLLDTPENKIEAERLWKEAHERAINKFRRPDDYVSAQMRQAGKSGNKFRMTQEQADSVLAEADQAATGFWQTKLNEAKKLLGDIINDEEGVFRPFGRSKGPDEPTNPPSPRLVKFTEALKAAKKAGPEQRKLYREARKKQFAKVAQVRQHTSGEAGQYAEKAAAKGGFEKVDIEPLRDKITPEERDEIINGIKSSKKLSGWEAHNATDGFLGLLDGKLPTKSEMALLYRVHPEIVKEILAKRPWSEKVKEYLWRGYETSRAQMGSGDVSFGGRQGLSMISRPEYWKATLGELKSLSPTRGDELLADQQERIVQSRHYDRAKKADLHLMELSDVGEREEYAPHGLIQDIPIIGQIPKASNRAYTYMANELRFGTFSNFLDKAEAAGKDIDDPVFLKAAGEWINTFTGRGQFGKGPLGQKLNMAMPAASVVLFAPRFVLSTFQRLNPLMWARLAQHPAVAKEALRDAGAHVAFVAGALGIANAAGYEIEWDPRNPTGLKIKKGNVTKDVGGGLVQTINFLSKMLTNSKVSGKGEESSLRDAGYGEDTNWSTLARFVRTKLHPTLGYLVNAKEGENVVGRKFDKVKDTWELLTPMYFNTLQESYEENGIESVFDAIGAAFGMGLSNYKPPEKETKPVSDEEFLNGKVEESSDGSELSKEDKEFLGL